MIEIKNIKGDVIYKHYEESLDRSDLTYEKLTGADLSNANLSLTKLTGADLSNSDLSNADLSYADFFGAILTFLANLSRNI